MEHERRAALAGPGYAQTLIAVADDCPVGVAEIPVQKGEKATVAALQDRLLADHPYRFTQAEVLFHTSLRATRSTDWEALRDAHRDDFFIQPRACLRTSPLPRQDGWGQHFDSQGRVALYAVDSEASRRLLTAADLKVIKVLRSKRA